MIADSLSVTAAPVDTDEAIFLATGGPERQGTVTHIGGGLFIGHNHGRNGTYTNKQKLLTFGLGLDGEQQVTRTAHYHFTQEGHLDNPGVSGGGEDIALYVADEPNDEIPAIPILVMSDTDDLIGERSIITRMATPGTTRDGIVHYSTGTITGATDETYFFSNQVVGGMSGSGIFVQIDTDGDGQTEDYTVGVVTAYGSGTAWDTGTYTDLADTLETIEFDPDTLPRYTLMSGVDRVSSSHQVNGTYLNENIIGGSWHDTLISGGGDDIMTGGDGKDTFVLSSKPGDVVITDFNVNLDILDLSNVTLPDWDFNQIGADVLVTYGGGENSILFQDMLLADIQDEFPVYNILRGSGSGTENFYGTPANDLIYGNSFKSIFNAGLDQGSDVYVGGTGVNHVWYKAAVAGVILDLENNVGHGGVAEGDHWFNMQSIQASNMDDIVYGSSHDDTVWLHDGNDQFFGGKGDDVVRLTLGTDYVDGGDGYDTVTFKAGDGHVIDVYAVGDARKTAAMNTYISVEQIAAHKFDDVITIGHGTGVQVLDANGGDDVLTIMAHEGTFLGGSGADTFVINPDNVWGTASDLVIGDFDASVDSLSILGEAIDLTGPISLPDGMSLSSDADGDLVIQFGSDDMVTFTGIDAGLFF
ncbi:calcium-binding protein [Chachezhania sediminis]|uniref:calcium-binding protein n=1 Tax=Chachezhania sediminis TaxID=2599291 RepID=UPI00131DFD1F|nr:hypothetical protein [Chachezhania sediminis]